MKSHWWSIVLSSLLLASLPASTNYQLNSYGIGSGGTAGSSSTNYSMNGITGEQSGSASSTHYQVGAGEAYLKQANVPIVTISNPGSWYDKLQIVLDPQNNPSDATFLVAISSDGFTTTQYVQDDFTLGSSIVPTDYMTYAELGGSGGVLLRGLTRTTVYSVKAAASRGAFTESQFGPVTSAATVDPDLSFDIGVSVPYNVTLPPYSLSMGSVIAGSVTTATDHIWLTYTTNANDGGEIYGEGANGGLVSASTGHTIASSSVDLATLTEGFGLQDTSVSQTSGGPMFEVAPYNVTGTNVGEDFIDLDEEFGTNTPVKEGVGELSLMAKSGSLTPSATDYTETLTEVAASNY